MIPHELNPNSLTQTQTISSSFNITRNNYERFIDIPSGARKIKKLKKVNKKGRIINEGNTVLVSMLRKIYL